MATKFYSKNNYIKGCLRCPSRNYIRSIASTAATNENVSALSHTAFLEILAPMFQCLTLKSRCMLKIYLLYFKSFHFWTAASKSRFTEGCDPSKQTPLQTFLPLCPLVLQHFRRADRFPDHSHRFPLCRRLRHSGSQCPPFEWALQQVTQT